MPLGNVAQLAGEGRQRVASIGIVAGRVCRGRPCVTQPGVACQRIITCGLVIPGGLRPDVGRGQRVRAARDMACLVPHGGNAAGFPETPAHVAVSAADSSRSESALRRARTSPDSVSSAVSAAPQPLHILVKGVVGMRQGQTQ